MKVVEGRLAALIEEILVYKQANSGVCVVRPVSSPLCQIEPAVAANDASYQSHGALAIATRLPAHTFSIFFAKRVKTCAKTAQKATRFVKTLAGDKRKRAALAACFFAFFSLFPSTTHRANLSTAPY